MLGKPTGIFDLEDSDNNCGSYLKKKDIITILNCKESDIDFVEFTRLNDELVIDERSFQKIWYNNKLLNKSNIKMSFDEMIFCSLLKSTYPDAEVIQQFRVGRKVVDFKIGVNNTEILLDFDGPNHFVMTKYGVPTDVRIRRDSIEKESGLALVNIPYWIQRSKNTVMAIIDGINKSRGALWSSEVFFGDFVFNDSAQIIIELSDRVNCDLTQGVGYFYEGWSGLRGQVKPTHPILDRIKNRRESLSRLLPKGAGDKKFWTPNLGLQP